MKNKAKNLSLIISGALTAIICVVMNFILIPKIESSTEGIKCFDMNFLYSFETAKKFLSLLSDEGRAVYLNIQLPLDFIYPLCYCAFFILALLKLSKRKAVIALPVLLAISDYTENICSIIMLKSETLSPSLAAFASGITAFKTVLMYIIFLIVITLFVIWLKNRKKD